MNVTRNGKIARLPKTVREELNRRLSDGEPGKDLVEWLNGLPQVRQFLAEDFGGRAVREQNLSEWKRGGYGDWLRQQEALELVRNLSAEADDLKLAAGKPLSDKLGLWLTARYAMATRKLATAADNGELDWQRLRELCNDVVALRRGDHSAARLEQEREETEEEVVAHFQRWAKNPKVRAAICGNCRSPEERQARMREIFGLPPEPAAEAAPIAPESNPAKLNSTQSNQIKPDELKASVLDIGN